MIEQKKFEENKLIVLDRIKNACRRSGRGVEEVKLMAVTKTWPGEAVRLAHKGGIEQVGENRVQEVVEKIATCDEVPVCWELIGPLQTNKVKDAVKIFHRIQTVDRLKLVKVLQKKCEESGIEGYRVLMQVNAGRDPAKSGVLEEEAEELATAILSSPNLKLEGLMTIGHLTEDERVVRECFRNLRRLRDRLEGKLSIKLPELSMGMSGDIEVAIEEGSTLVRVGSSLFGSR